MVSVGMLNGAKYGLGDPLPGKRKITKADKKLVDEMERDFLKGTDWVRVDNRKK
ncbi:hypothetical protein [Methanomicrobium mobile]|uniref:hypothetical protein n=1 Tax=Methanomicrobium mobile TaxID=2205 RepID=UPI0012F67D72|nr:hypothetical protein [Methanomicrobium mobile]